jgi:hypothetical protein
MILGQMFKYYGEEAFIEMVDPLSRCKINKWFDVHWSIRLKNIKSYDIIKRKEFIL